MPSRSSHRFSGAAETLAVGQQRVHLERHALDSCRVDLAHLDGVVSGLVAQRGSPSGAVLCAVDSSGHVVGAGGLEFTRPAGAYGAVAVVPDWRHRGLGAALAHRVTLAALDGGVRYLTCRCVGGVEEAERTVALFDQVCVSRIQVAYYQLLVLRLAA